ncbi:MAG: DNA-binding protein [Thermodesulfovibrionia bacterium]|nr:DNA-binding protein [Thermodesulfovibrionia bacterium]
MKYQVGRQGRMIVAKFDDGDDVLKGLVDIAKKEDIRAGVLYVVGGMKKGDIVVGPEDESLPPVPVWKSLDESHEVVGIGTIFWQDDEPKIHFHGAFGKKDMMKIGCLRKNSEAFLVLEVIIMEIEGVDAKRVLDPEVGLALLKL